MGNYWVDDVLNPFNIQALEEIVKNKVYDAGFNYNEAEEVWADFLDIYDAKSQDVFKWLLEKLDGYLDYIKDKTTV